MAKSEGVGCMQWARRIIPYLVFSVLVILSANGFAASARFAFGVNGEDFSLSRYRVDVDGGLRYLGHMPIDKSPSDIVIDPTGQFVVAVSNTTDRIMVFRLNAANGELRPVPGSPFATGARSPFSLRFHPSGRFLYAGVRFGGVGAFSFDPKTGAVKPLPGSPFPAQRRTREITIHPSGKFLYAVNGFSNSVSAYRIDEKTGNLEELSESPYSVGDFAEINYLDKNMLDVPPEAGGLPHSIDMDPQGRFIFVANKAGGSDSVFRIDGATGKLATVAGSPFFVGFNPYRSRVHPSGRFVLTALWADGKIAVHAIDRSSGRLTEVAGSPFAVNSLTPVDLTFNADGSQVYVSNYDGNEITLMNMDVVSGKLGVQESLMTRLSPWSLVLMPEDGQVTQSVQQTLFATGGKVGVMRLDRATDSVEDSVFGHGDALAVASNGRFVYTLNTIEGSIAAYAIDSEQGHMTAISGGVVKTGMKPTDMAIDVNGWYLYVTNSGDASMSVYYLNPASGIPEPVRGSPMPAGKRPVAIALDVAMRYAFVVNADSNNISVYRYLNNVTPLMFEGRKYGSPFATEKEPLALALEPTGHFVYVANAGSDNVSVYRIHRKTGALAPIPGSPFKTGKRPVDLQVHPEGRWLYVANQDSSTLTVHRIEAGFGALAGNEQTVALPVQPAGIWFDESGGSLLVLAKDRRRVLSYSVNDQTGGVRLKSDKRFLQPVNDLAFARTAGAQKRH